MARTRWPPGPVIPGLLPRPGRSDRQRRWVPKTGARPTDRYQDHPSGVGRFAGQAGTQSPTLRPYHRKTSEAGPELYPHPPCRLFTGSGARSLVVALCADLTFMYLFELVAGDLCGPVTWSGATSAVAHLSLLGSAGVVWPGAAGCRYGWLRRVKRWGGPQPGAGWWRWISDVVWGAAGFVRAGVVWGGGVCSFLVRAH